MSGRPAGASADTRNKLLDAANDLIRLKGYAATTVDDLCRAAGLTKGSFFHHFSNKEALGVAAAHHFGDNAAALFAIAPYRELADPVDRLLAYVDLRIGLLRGPIHQYSCLLGTFVQEVHDTSAAIRDACDEQLSVHIRMLAADLAEAKTRYAPDAEWSPNGVAAYMQAVTQGALILAKAQQGPTVAVECFRLLRAYLESLFVARHASRRTDHRSSHA